MRFTEDRKWTLFTNPLTKVKNDRGLLIFLLLLMLLLLLALKDRSIVHGRNTPDSIPRQDDTVTLDLMSRLNYAHLLPKRF